MPTPSGNETAGEVQALQRLNTEVLGSWQRARESYVHQLTGPDRVTDPDERQSLGILLNTANAHIKRLSRRQGELRAREDAARGRGYGGPAEKKSGAGGKGGAPTPETPQQKAIKAHLPLKQKALIQLANAIADYDPSKSIPMSKYQGIVSNANQKAARALATLEKAAKAEGLDLDIPKEPVPLPKDLSWAQTVVDYLERAIGDEENILRGGRAPVAPPGPPPPKEPIKAVGFTSTLGGPSPIPETPPKDESEPDRIKHKRALVENLQALLAQHKAALDAEDFSAAGAAQDKIGALIDASNSYLNEVEGVSAAFNENYADGVLDRLLKAIATETRMLSRGGPGGRVGAPPGGRGGIEPYLTKYHDDLIRDLQGQVNDGVPGAQAKLAKAVDERRRYLANAPSRFAAAQTAARRFGRVPAGPGFVLRGMKGLVT